MARSSSDISVSPSSPIRNVDGERVSPNIIRTPDGKFHWYYEFPLMRNPTILLLLWKIFFWIMFGIYLFLVLLDILGGDITTEKFLHLSKAFGIFAAGFEGVVLLGYLFYAALMGWKYRVKFDMDEKEVVHTQLPLDREKAAKMAFLTVLVSLAAKSPTAAGAGMLAGSKTSSVSDFSRVKKLVIRKGRNLIKVNEPLEKNQVYAADEDFDFVAGWIKARVSPGCKIVER